MTPSERLALELALQPQLTECVEGVDLWLSSISAAVHHYRRASACLPFPALGPPAKASMAEGPAKSADPDYRGLGALLDALPPVRQLAQQPESSAQLPDAALRLLQWLLLHPTRRRRFAVVTPAQVLDAVGESAVAGLSAALREATVVLQLLTDKPQQAAAQRQGVNATSWALHGTSFENVYSILHNGLLNLSGTYLQRTGAAFGKGIYLAREYTTAASFSAAQDGWKSSELGRRLRAVLLCEVAQYAEQAVEGSRKQGPAVPPHYVIVTRPDAVRLAYVLLFKEVPQQQLQRQRIWANPCLLLVMIYAFAVLVLPLARQLL